MKQQFVELGLSNTYLDEAGPIIYNRAKYYVRYGKKNINITLLKIPSYVYDSSWGLFKQKSTFLH